ncbi:hypothetical protein CB0940_09159 [Lecanosticta acicola]|uniref:SMODS and SLOG-associating 2TM effector domain-containing protein n=1 Tax=Lecanosticta acicola TaxID=111012 RepID=A0AAI8YVZ6_9PEZI|nr:hypothetical protein CB0940_09159 [Lecanosticta acicola]
MLSEADERAPLLQFPGFYSEGREPENLPDAYKQFCTLIGNRPLELPKDARYNPPKDSLYYRAIQHGKMQGRMYAFTSALTNTLLLSQVVLGAALTGLGASDSSRVLITVFGALNTVIAGLVAFMKSRGQPMRARMFRDDLDRVVDEIENSATMWKGISQKIHGYDAIDTDDSVTVRSEVARLTRLYDRAVKTNTLNDPDFYGAGISVDPHNAAGLRSRTGQTPLPAMPSNMPPPAAGPASAATDAAPAPLPAPSADPDESPATKAPTAPSPKKKDDDKGKEPDKTADPNAKKPDVSQTPAPAAVDPDESPATTAKPAKPPKDETKPNGEANAGAPKPS